jgi:hypothetical protein
VRPRPYIGQDQKEKTIAMLKESLAKSQASQGRY